MQLNIKKSMTVTGLLALCAFLFSFSTKPGGDKYEIYLNNKLVMEQYVAMKNAPQFLTLYRGNYNNKISVSYSHCGVPGKDRSIVIKDENNRTVKEWKFGDGTAKDDLMTWDAKDLIDLQSANGRSSLKLYYVSRELPQGRLLATIVQGGVVQI